MKVDQIGEDVVQWSVSRPDGSGATGGKGPIPAALRQTLKLDEVLGGGSVKRWAMLSSTGDVLETGTGEVPADVLSKVGVSRGSRVLNSLLSCLACSFFVASGLFFSAVPGLFCSVVSGLFSSVASGLFSSIVCGLFCAFLFGLFSSVVSGLFSFVVSSLFSSFVSGLFSFVVAG